MITVLSLPDEQIKSEIQAMESPKTEPAEILVVDDCSFNVSAI